VDSGTNAVSFTPLPGSITPISVASSNMMTYYSQSIYTFTFNTDHNIPANGYIQVTFPSDITLKSTSTC
jgi:hypothetical protein